MEHISWLGVVVSALTLFVLGGVWFSALFGKVYRRELGMPATADGEDAMPPGPQFARALAGQFLAGIVMSIALAWLIGSGTVGHGTACGFVAGVLVAAALTQLAQFEGRSLTHLLLTTGYMVVGLTAAGAILGAFQG